MLYNKFKLATTYDEYITYKDKVFDEKHLIKVVKDALENPKYKENIQKMKVCSQVTGGRELMIQTIERFYIAGSDHLIDHELISKYTSMSAFCTYLSTLIVLAIFAAGIFFTVLYFMKE